MSDSTPPRALVAHRLPGRLRLRIPARRGDAGYFDQITRQAATEAAISGLWANPRTGSLLVAHDGDAASVARFGRENRLFDTGPLAPDPAPASAAPALPSLDAARVAALGLATLGLVQVARGRIAGAASESFWAAFSAQARLRNPWAAAALAGLGVVQLARGEVLGSAASLLYYALSTRSLAAAEAERTPSRADAGRES